jgi:hypothetical protein
MKSMRENIEGIKDLTKSKMDAMNIVHPPTWRDTLC